MQWPQISCKVYIPLPPLEYVPGSVCPLNTSSWPHTSNPTYSTRQISSLSGIISANHWVIQSHLTLQPGHTGFDGLNAWNHFLSMADNVYLNMQYFNAQFVFEIYTFEITASHIFQGPADNKTLLEATLTQIYVPLWCHQATPDYFNWGWLRLIHYDIAGGNVSMNEWKCIHSNSNKYIDISSNDNLIVQWHK